MKTKESIIFGKLSVGDSFVYKNSIYTKSCEIGEYYYNAIESETGRKVKFQRSVEVFKID